MEPTSKVIEWILGLTDNNLTIAIVGWVFGWIGAVWSNRRHDRRQRETIKVLSDALAAFGDRIKDHLTPLNEAEEGVLNAAIKLFFEADVPPNAATLYFRALLRGLALSFAVMLVPLVLMALLSALFPDTFEKLAPFLVISIYLGLFLLIGSFPYAADLQQHAASFETRILYGVQEELK